jgi:hypothetical protein
MRLQSDTPDGSPEPEPASTGNERCFHGAVEKTVLGAFTFSDSKMSARLSGS